MSASVWRVPSEMSQQASERRVRLLGRRELLIAYLMENVREEDWHGCADACMDLREVDAELRGLKHER